MILELALLDVRAEEAEEFEAAFRAAVPIIWAISGFLDLELQRCLESRHRYLLIVHWRRPEDHTAGFRRSPEYARWRELLQRFHDPFRWSSTTNRSSDPEAGPQARVLASRSVTPRR